MYDPYKIMDRLQEIGDIPDRAFKPCCRCGTPTIMKVSIDLTGYYKKGVSVFVGCFTCHCRTPNTYDPYEAIRMWNAGNVIKE